MTYIDTGAATDLAMLARCRGTEIEKAQRLPSDLAHAIRISPLLRLLMPSELGGYGGAWQQGIDAVETVAKSDGSTGWSLMIGMVGNMLTGYLDRQESLHLFRGEQAPFLAGVFEPRGIGVLDDTAGHYRISGRWRFATGIHLSDWCCTGAIFRTPDGPEVRQFLHSTASVSIRPNWNVIGLSGTGSDDVELSNAEVPVCRSFSFDDTPWPVDHLWRVPFFSVAASLMAAAVLGMTRSGLDFVISSGTGSERALMGFGYNQSLEVEVANAEATLRSARSFLFETVEQLHSAAKEGKVPNENERAIHWLAAIHAVRSCCNALDMLFTNAGASAIRMENPLQRCWRDAKVAGQHVLVTRRRLDAVGRVLLGEAANSKPFL